MKLAWLTDIHLNFLDDNERKSFYQHILKTNSDAIVLTGDIAEAPSLVELLAEIAENIGKPIYFILGNHDYYRGQINEVREALKKFCNTNNNLFFLSTAGLQKLDGQTILVGQDGWADGRLGDYANSRVSLNDSRMIADLFQANMVGKFKLLEKMQELADIDAKNLQNDLLKAITLQPKKIIALTHVPPFKEACMHEGKISDDNWLPYFSSKIMGDILLQTAQENPTVEYLVLCGHTHSKAYYQPLPNLIIKAGEAKYYQPQVQEIINV